MLVRHPDRHVDAVVEPPLGLTLPDVDAEILEQRLELRGGRVPPGAGLRPPFLATNLGRAQIPVHLFFSVCAGTGACLRRRGFVAGVAHARWGADRDPVARRWGGNQKAVILEAVGSKA